MKWKWARFGLLSLVYGENSITPQCLKCYFKEKCPVHIDNTYEKQDVVKFVYCLKETSPKQWSSEFFDTRNQDEISNLNIQSAFPEDRTYQKPKVIQKSDLARVDEVNLMVDMEKRPLLRYLSKLIYDGGNFNIICRQRHMKSILQELINYDKELIVLLKTTNFIFLIESERFKLRFLSLNHFAPRYEEYFTPKVFFPLSLVVECYFDYFGELPPFFLFEERRDTQSIKEKKLLWHQSSKSATWSFKQQLRKFMHSECLSFLKVCEQTTQLISSIQNMLNEHCQKTYPIICPFQYVSISTIFHELLATYTYNAFEFRVIKGDSYIFSSSFL